MLNQNNDNVIDAATIMDSSVISSPESVNNADDDASNQGIKN